MDLQGALRELIHTYHELNPASIDELEYEPSPLKFLRYVANNQPFVVRGGAKSWKAFDCWNTEYFKSKMGESKIQVAVTPDG